MLTDVQWNILRCTLVHRVLVIALLFVGAIVQSPFDSSAWLQIRLDATSSPISTFFTLPLLRWDTLHFLAMASPRPLPLPASASLSGHLPRQAKGGGIQSEQSLAFQPGIVWILKIFGSRGINDLSWSPSQSVLVTSSLATVLSVCLPLLLYSLTRKVTRDDRFSKVAAYLSILSPSPSTLVTPTPETFFSFFALLGHLCLSSFDDRHQLLRLWIASLCYAIATTFRANGILFLGFVIWQIFWQQTTSKSFLSKLFGPVLALLCMSPFLLSQGFAYIRFCSSELTQRDWCSNLIPSVYTYVQDRYWNVGLFRYWTLAQLPNWILASPVLILAFLWVLTYYQDHPSTIRMTFSPWKAGNTLDMMTAHCHFTTITLLILVFNSHVQIALRFASPGGLPAFWWGASQLLLRTRNSRSKNWAGLNWTKILVGYLVIWNVSSIILYAGFYPPA